jgi:DNA-binding HxlR family transcriptional regulator
MRVLDVLGRRWALRILWELRTGPQTFRALRAACDDVSPSSLNQRLAELRALGAIERREDGYALSRAGGRLGKIVLDLHRWAEAMLSASVRAEPPRRRRKRRNV